MPRTHLNLSTILAWPIQMSLDSYRPYSRIVVEKITIGLTATAWRPNEVVIETILCVSEFRGRNVKQSLRDLKWFHIDRVEIPDESPQTREIPMGAHST